MIISSEQITCFFNRYFSRKTKKRETKTYRSHKTQKAYQEKKIFGPCLDHELNKQ